MSDGYKEGLSGRCIVIQLPVQLYDSITLQTILRNQQIVLPLPITNPTHQHYNIKMVCCGRNNGECVCAKEATCSCGKQPALQCSMPLFLHPHPSCNYCFRYSASHVIKMLTHIKQTALRPPTRTRCLPTPARAERGLRVCDTLV